MSSALKAHLPIILLVTVLGIFSGMFFLTAVRDNAGMFAPGLFTWILIGIPCLVMAIGAFIIMLTAKEIGSRILIIVEAICVGLGLVSTVVISGWEGDPTIVAAVLANDPNATITPVMNSPFGIIRNIMLYLLCPMVGSILGAWVGSRLHPLSVDKNNKEKKTKTKTKTNTKKRQG